MKKIIYLIFVAAGMSLSSCNKDILDKAPLDQISEPEFWKTDNDLKLYVTGLYNTFGGWASYGTGAASLPDNGTDISIFAEIPTRINGTGTIPATGGGWVWTNIRNANYFLANVGKVKTGSYKQYKGEGYFFRASFYFSLLKSFGALPIIDRPLNNNDVDFLYAERQPRNKIADFIIADLDSAIANLSLKAQLAEPRINKDVALLFKARVCLFEGTWEKYHKNDVFGVNGADGSAYIQKAADAAKLVIDGTRYTLKTGDITKVYYEMFNQSDLTSNPEIMFWKQYNISTFGNAYGNDVNATWPNKTGFTNEMIGSYLCSDGLPISISPLYKGDANLTNVIINRDPRLKQSVMTPGDIQSVNVSGAVVNFTIPTLTGINLCPTAYEYKKFRQPQYDAATGLPTRNTAFIHMRFAEALLTYAEAKAELGSITQGDIDLSINKLRSRVGMPNLVISNITVDPNWPDYGYSVSPVLQEIRRERKVEFFGEGYRWDDLMRWNAHKLFIGKRPQGAFYTAEFKAKNKTLTFDALGYLDPYQKSIPNGYGFNPARDYLLPIPTNEITLNPKLTQNPGW